MGAYVGSSDHDQYHQARCEPWKRIWRSAINTWQPGNGSVDFYGRRLGHRASRDRRHVHAARFRAAVDDRTGRRRRRREGDGARRSDDAAQQPLLTSPLSTRHQLRTSCPSEVCAPACIVLCHRVLLCDTTCQGLSRWMNSLQTRSSSTATTAPCTC